MSSVHNFDLNDTMTSTEQCSVNQLEKNESHVSLEIQSSFEVQILFPEWFDFVTEGLFYTSLS